MIQNKNTESPLGFIMMKIIEIHYSTRRCTADTVGMTAKTRKSQGRTIKCINYASYLVDGKPRCNLHAKNEALNFIVEKSS